jgi:hypothetical protein
VYYFGNPALAPEHQRGGEAGLDLYLGTRASVIITRYNQIVDGLIATPKVDSVRSLAPNPAISNGSRDADGYAYAYEYQYLNVGSIRNQGWELQGSINIGPFSTRATYSWTKSRTIGVNPRYRTYFNPITYPSYQVGATFSFLPEHTWAVGTTYARAGTTMAIDITGIGRLTNARDAFYIQNLSTSIRLPQYRQIWSPTTGYISSNNGYAMADLTASRQLASSRVEGIVQVL